MSKEEMLKQGAKSDFNEKPINSDQIQFLGQSISQSEYRECCENLKSFFDLLRSWREGDENESAELQAKSRKNPGS